MQGDRRARGGGGCSHVGALRRRLPRRQSRRMPATSHRAGASSTCGSGNDSESAVPSAPRESRRAGSGSINHCSECHGATAKATQMGDELDPKATANPPTRNWKHGFGPNGGDVSGDPRRVSKARHEGIRQKNDRSSDVGRRKLRSQHRPAKSIEDLVADDVPALAIELLRAEDGGIVDARSGRSPASSRAIWRTLMPCWCER